jgi:hypothetical protein
LTDPSTKQFTVLSHLQSSNPTNGRRYSSNNFEPNPSSASGSFEEESEVLELVLRFLGPWGKSFYQTILMMLMFVGLIAYTQVFVNTFQLQIAPNIPTAIPSFLFGLIAIPLSCVDLAEQISVQVVMSILRFLSLATLLFGTIAAMFIDPHPSFSSTSVSGEEREDLIPYYQFSGFGLMFTTAIFSQLFQHSVPGLIRPLHKSEKQHVSTIFSWALVTTGAIYILTGIICTIYFRSDLNPAINLNFVSYYWGMTPPPPTTSILSGSYLLFLLVKSLSMLIVLFPALDTLSVFPLIANTLGNNFHAAFPKGYKQTTKYLGYLPPSLVQFLLRSSSPSHSSSSSSASSAVVYSTSNSHQIRQLTLRCWRLVAAIPPVVVSLYVTNLSLTLQVAGTCGVLVALVVPALLQYFSLLEVPDLPSLTHDKKYNPNAVHFEPNPYGSHFSELVYVYLVLFIALIALGICLLQIVSSLV